MIGVYCDIVCRTWGVFLKKDKRLFERLIRMLNLIPVSPRTVTAGQLHQSLTADGFEVTKRTVERDLIQLSESFGIFNDDSRLPHGWRWQKESPRLSLPGLTPEEALTLKLAEGHLNGLMPVSLLENIQPYFVQAEKVLQNPLLYKSYAKWLDKVKVVHPWQPMIPPEVDESVLAAIHRAMMEERQLELLYQSRADGNAQPRTVHPLGIVIRGYVAYLVCTIHPFTDVRLLAMHRMQAATVTEIAALIPHGFSLKEYADGGALGFSGFGMIQLQLKFKKTAGMHLLESPLVRDQIIVETEDAITLTANVIDNVQLRWWILGFGAQVEVLSPPHLREVIYNEISKAMAAYTTNHGSFI